GAHEAAVAVRAAPADGILLHQGDAGAGLVQEVSAGRADHPTADDHDAFHRPAPAPSPRPLSPKVGERGRGEGARIPMQKGSRKSSSRVDSALTNAVPFTRGIT